MKNFSVLFFFVILLALIGCEKEDSSIVSTLSDDISLQKSGDIIDGQYIVIFNERSSGLKSRGQAYSQNKNRVREQAKLLFQKTSLLQKQLGHVYASALEGFSVS